MAIHKDLKKLLEDHPDRDAIRKALKVVEKMEKAGISREGYRIRSPFARRLVEGGNARGGHRRPPGAI
jgi:hypothetical protein